MRDAEAVATVHRLADQVEALPPAVVADLESLWGWPEHRLRHAESWVYTHAGRLRDAERAQQRAMELYPQSQVRSRTQVGLHQAAALIRGGHIPDGLRLAADLLDGLPVKRTTRWCAWWPCTRPRSCGCASPDVRVVRGGVTIKDRASS